MTKPRPRIKETADILEAICMVLLLSIDNSGKTETTQDHQEEDVLGR